MDLPETEEMRTLVAQLNDAAEAYYAGRGEKMTDYEWDAAFDRLKALEEKTGIILENSPTANVSSSLEDGEKVKHEYPALSLAKTKQISQLAKWAESRAVCLSWKLDGLTLVATYDGGELTSLATRGDGEIGTNILRLASGIRHLPQKIPDTSHIIVRGEAVITYADFESFCEISGSDFANPRNLASGSLTLKNLDEFKSRNIQFKVFTPVYFESCNDKSWMAKMDALEAMGFSTVEREKIDAPTLESLEAVVGRWTKKVSDGENPFPVDGLVLCYDDTEYAKTGSVTGHHAVRAGLAFKWADETASATLDHIEWSCAVNSIAPVAVFSPVELEGTLVKRASLCNISECERLGIGAKGTKIEVIKANKIIPKVVKVSEKVGEFAPPDFCPVCNAPTKVDISATLTKKLVCTNESCPARMLRLFMRFVAKDALDIDGLGGETLSKFVNCGWIKTRLDILHLKDHRLEIAAMDGFGEKSAANIVAAIEKSRTCGAVNFLVSLAIAQVGADAAKRLLGAYSLEELQKIACDSSTPRNVFASIDGIGEVTSASIVEWFRQEANATLFSSLLSELNIEPYVAPAKEGRCAGLVFVVTGELETYASRSELKAYIESQGGKVAGSVSTKTSFLVNNDATSTSGKNKKAQALSIPVITEAQFNERFKN